MMAGAGAEAAESSRSQVGLSAKAVQEITPDYVTTLDKPTEDFLCDVEANIFEIEFVGFKIRTISDEGKSNVVFEVGDDVDEDNEPEVDAVPEDDIGRKIAYKFGPDFLEQKTIGKLLVHLQGIRTSSKRIRWRCRG